VPARSRRRIPDGVGRAIEYAKALKVPQLNCLVGIPSASTARDQTFVTMVDNLRFAADALRREGIRLLVEPCNRFDIPGFALNRSSEGLDVIRAVGSDNLFLQYDIYHMQRMEGELAATIERNLASIGHVQLADNPAATNRARARSTTRSCSRCSTGSITTATSAANTNPAPPRRKGSAGCNTSPAAHRARRAA
jgi:hydroxypyruvate isomerase